MENVTANNNTKANRNKSFGALLCFVGISSLGIMSAAQADLPAPHAGDWQYNTETGIWTVPNVATMTSDGTKMIVAQQTDKAILNWQNFNISAGNRVDFQQPSSSSIALNRIVDANPSQINGTLKANGQIYLINHNGILFGKNTQVNVQSLVASTLDVDDDLFKNSSIVAAISNRNPAFTGNGRTVDENGNPIAINIEDGASIVAGSGGQVLIFAPHIENNGTIETPDGQTILAAASDKVYLTASDKDPGLRGLLVEVGTGGEVRNGGSIKAKRGNITLMGFAINQDGILSATTSTRVNGSIRLLARDGAATEIKERVSQPDIVLGIDDLSSKYVAYATETIRDGEHQDGSLVTFGENSRTAVTPDTIDTSEVVKDQETKPSKVEVMAHTIDLEKNAKITANGGEIALTATASPDDPAVDNTNRNTSRVYMADGSNLDVSGTSCSDASDTNCAVLPMTRNQVDVELRGNELRDSPLQRDGVLYGQTITVDLRQGTPLADISGAVNGIKQGVFERLSEGGTVTVTSEGDFVMREGAVVDFSGGSVRYEDGYLNTTKLISDGQIIDIAQADPNRTYQGIFGVYTQTSKKWGVTHTWNLLGPTGLSYFVPGYTEGKSAGSFNLTAANAVVDGKLRGSVVYGPFQRTLDQLPTGGAVDIDLARFGLSGINVDGAFASPEIVFSSHKQPLSLESANDPLPTVANPWDAEEPNKAAPIVLDAGLFASGGIAKATVKSNGVIKIEQGAAVTLPAGGQLTLNGVVLDVQGDITAPSGTVNLTGAALGDAIFIGGDSHIEVGGQWVNDSVLLNPNGPTGPVFVNGGTVTVSAQGDVTLAHGSIIDASGGAWLHGDGSITAGHGGDIFIGTTWQGGSQLTLNADLRSYSLTDGGTLAITANAIRIQDADVPFDPLYEIVNDRPAGELVDAQRLNDAGGVLLVPRSADTTKIVDPASIRNLASYIDSEYVNADGSINEALLLERGLVVNPGVLSTEGKLIDRSLVSADQIIDPEKVIGFDAAVTGSQYDILRDENGHITAERLSAAGLTVNPRFLADPYFVASPAFFRQGGFSAYNLTSNLRGAEIADNTVLRPQQQNLHLASDFAARPTGSDMRAFTTPTLFPDFRRNPVDFNMTLDQTAVVGSPLPAEFTIGDGAEVHTDPRGQVTLSSDNSLMVNGVIDAPAGEITLEVAGPELETGFFANQGIWLGDSARLLAQGVFVSEPNDTGLTQGQVLPGGNVSLIANRGFIVTAPGSAIDVSATTHTVDLPNGRPDALAPTPVFAPAGRIAFSSGEGIFLQGTLAGQSGDAPGAAAGELSLTLDQSLRRMDFNQPAVSGGEQRFPFDPLTIKVVEGDSAAFPTLEQGDAVPADYYGTALVTATTLQDGGFDALSLKAIPYNEQSGKYYVNSAIEFGGDVSLSMRRSITLDAPTIAATDGSHVSLVTAYLAMGPTEVNLQNGFPAAPGDATFDAAAQFIDLIGKTNLAGFGSTRLASQGDIRLIGVRPNENANDLFGAFTAYGDLRLRADQIYPATLTQFTIMAQDSETTPGAITVIPGSGSTPVLSAAGSLTMQASTIDQYGVLKAPFGSVNLQASQRLALHPGSVTSVSGEGQTIPFGYTQFGVDWLYQVGPANLVLFDNAPDFNEPGNKTVALNAPDVALEQGAVVDVSGGGDLYAYEFTPGPGGSRDVLDATNPAFTESYAILPTSDSLFATYDPYESSNFGFHPTDSVYLSGAPGVPAGQYALLPAHYALLPGAYLVTPIAGTQDIQPGQAVNRLDGVPVVAGYRTVAGTDIRDSRWSGFIVEPGSMARLRSEYQDSYANTFFAQRAAADSRLAPVLPADAGRLTIAVDQQLSLQGTMRAGAASGGRGGQLDIAAPSLAVVETLTDSTDRVELLADDLNSFGADSILLGGTRTDTPAGVQIDVMAHDIVVAQGAELAAPAITLAATGSADGGGITVETGATITGTGNATGSARPLIVGRSGGQSGNGALLRVSAGEPVDLIRRNVHAADPAGVLVIAEGAKLSADGSMILDATGDTEFAGDLALNGGALDLGANHIDIGGSGDQQGLVLDANDLLSLSGLAQLKLRSATGIDVYGDATVSATEMLVDTPLIAGHLNQDQRLSVSAGTFTLTSSYDAVEATPSEVNGLLAVDADNVVLRQGQDSTRALNVGIQGFDVDITARRQITAQGEGGVTVGGDLTVHTPLLTGAGGADLAITAADHTVVIDRQGVDAAFDAPQDLGARIVINAGDITQASSIVLPSGTVTLRAATGNVSLAAGSLTDVSGRAVPFQQFVVNTPGGAVDLGSEGGDVTVAGGDSAAVVDVSGSGVDGAAGMLTATAPQGAVTLDGQLRAVTGGAPGGAFRLDAKTLDGDNATVTALSQMLGLNGFNAEQVLRLHQGDIALEEGGRVAASHVRLVADNGAIDIAGAIDASGQKSGLIELYASKKLTLAGSARLTAVGQTECGGKVVLTSGQGAIDIAATDTAGDHTIDVHGVTVAVTNDDGTAVLDANGAAVTTQDTGSVQIRLRRDQVADSHLQGAITGADRINVEAFKVYCPTPQAGCDAAPTNGTVGQINSALINYIKTDTGNDMAGLAGAFQNLGIPNPAAYHFVPGIEIQSDADLTLATQWDLSSWRYDGEPGVLTMRAKDNLSVLHSLTDGFALGAGADPFTGEAYDVLQPDRSWSYRIVAGSDLASADPLSVVSGQGDMIVEAAKIRTGTGDIDIATGGGLKLNDATSSIYTAGRSTGFGKFGQAFGEYIGYIFPAEYPADGGDVRIIAGGDISAVASQQLPTEWLWRIGGVDGSNSAYPTAWGIAPDKFAHGTGALGGGDIAIEAGGAIEDLSVAIPTTSEHIGDVTLDANLIASYSDNSQYIRGGGDLSVFARGDILGGVYFVDGGVGNLRTQGAFTSPAGAINPRLLLGSGEFNVTSAKMLDVESVANVTVLPQTAEPLFNDAKFLTDFFTYGEDSRASLMSLGAGVFLHNDVGGNSKYWPGTVKVAALSGDVTIGGSFTLYPTHTGGLEVLAARNITTPGTHNTVAVHVPDVDPANLPGAANPIPFDSILLDYSGADAALIHAAEPLHLHDPAPVVLVAAGGDIAPQAGFFLISSKKVFMYAARDIRSGDGLQLVVQNVTPQDVSIVQAGRDIVFPLHRVGTGAIGSDHSTIELAGQGRLDVIAGRNIDLGTSTGIITVGNLKNPHLPSEGADIVVSAGYTDSGVDAFLERYFMTNLSQAAFLDYMRQVSGDTTLDDEHALAAFKALGQEQQQTVLDALHLTPADIQGLSDGLAFRLQRDQFIQALSRAKDGQRDIGLLFKAYDDMEPADKAKLSAELGMSIADLNGLADTVEYQYWAVSTSAGGAITPDQLDQWDAALAQFASAPDWQQRGPVFRAFFNELQQSGIAATSDTLGDYSRGFQATETLFGAGGDIKGDLSLLFSKIYTTNGGNIDIAVPGGLVNAGVASSASLDKKPYQLGIVVQQEGDINAFVKDDFLVNQSRVFAMGGGNIMLWSAEGDIDAGRGAKTALAAQSSQTYYDYVKNEFVTVFPSTVSGSGIRGYCPGDCAKPGDVYLFAPKGVVNASDAGIGSAGNITVGAVQVLGGDNFDIGGSATGVPVVDTSSFAAGLTGVSNVSNSVAQSATDSVTNATNSQTPQADKALAFLDVFIVGFGEETADSKE